MISAFAILLVIAAYAIRGSAAEPAMPPLSARCHAYQTARELPFVMMPFSALRQEIRHAMLTVILCLLLR